MRRDGRAKFPGMCATARQRSIWVERGRSITLCRLSPACITDLGLIPACWTGWTALRALGCRSACTHGAIVHRPCENFLCVLWPAHQKCFWASFTVVTAPQRLLLADRPAASCALTSNNEA